MSKFMLITALILFVSASVIGQRYIFSLHGMILEGHGPGETVTGNGYGVYNYEGLLAALRKEKFTVITEYRKRNTDVKEYAAKVVRQVDSLLHKGVQPGNITVLGASKGALIAMNVSSLLKNEKVNFIFLSSCNEGTFSANPDLDYCGNILSVYETSDEMGHSCINFKEHSRLPIPHYKEIPLSTGLKHGYFYQPLPIWLNPVIAWAKGNYK